MAMQGPGGEVAVQVDQPKDSIEELFTYHAPTEEQKVKYLELREAAKAFVYVIDRCCPPGPDRTAAVRHIGEASMTANRSIATNNAQYR